MQQTRMDSRPTVAPDEHATTQTAAFLHHLESALSAAGAQQPQAALTSVGRAATAFGQLVPYLHRRSKRGPRPDLQTVHQPLGAARERLRAGSWAEAVAQLQRMRAAGLVIIRSLGGRVPDDHTVSDGTVNSSGSSPPPDTRGPIRRRPWRQHH